MKTIQTLCAVAFAGASLWANAEVSTVKPAPGKVPDRPEKLKYPPLVYEPPAQGDFRVQLKGGPVAYVAADRELPLVSIAIYVRTGDYVEPESKEGVTDLTGYMLARGASGTPNSPGMALGAGQRPTRARVPSALASLHGIPACR